MKFSRGCSIEDCERPHYGRGWCKAHYQRWLDHGDPQGGRPPKADHCKIDGCDRPPDGGRGWCGLHYLRWKRKGDPGPLQLLKGFHGPVCIVPSCDRKTRDIGYCNLHAQRYRRYGDPQVTLIGQGDDVGYTAVHKRKRLDSGKAREYPCAHCEGPAAQWAYDHMDVNEKRTSSGRLYSVDLARYMPLCSSCHKRFDLMWSGHVAPVERCEYGLTWTDEP